jgi:ATP-dependent protease ClpP protease subunit
MADMPSFQLPKNPTRIWDLEVPIVVDDKRNTISAYITGAIEEPSHYNELCYLLNIADEGTIVYLHINTRGGIIDSAGTLISMACDELEVAPHLSFIIHNYSGGMSGKGHEMKARQKFTDKHLNEAFTRFYKGFLTEDEMDNVVNGSDFWMGSEDVKSRWGQRVSYLLSQA